MKRFTETEKWRDPWFRKLSPGAKLAFSYIVDNCDNAGVWDCDTELADFAIGMAIPWDKVREAFGDRVNILPCGKWHLTKFIQFQCGTLSPDCKPHQSVYRLLEKHGLSKQYPKGIHTLEEKEKENEKEEDRKGKGSGEGKPKKDKATQDEILVFFADQQLPVSDAEWFFNKCEGNGWTNQGRPILDWRATVRSWRAAEYLPSQKPKLKNGNNRTEADRDRDRTGLQSTAGAALKRL